MKHQRKSEFPSITKLNSRRLVVVAGILIVAGAAIWAANMALSNLVRNQNDESFQYEATVVVGPDGYTPSVLKVKPHTRVYFENHSDANHSVDVSSKEPDPAFGSGGSIQPQSGYAFSFNQSGTYMFHDGNNPTANGEVIVQ